MSKIASLSDLQTKSAEPTRALSEEVTLPSGLVFLLRRLPIAFWIKSGRIPDGFLKVGMKAWSLQGLISDEEVGKILSPQEQLDSIIFIRESVVEACVEPRLSLNPVEGESVHPSVLSEADFDYIFKYATNQEGGEASALGNFRAGR